MKKLVFTLELLSVFLFTNGQNSALTRSSFLTAGFLQIKESANFGLVFKGSGINYGMTWNKENEKSLMTFEYKLGVGILFSREIPALGFYLKPVDFSYMFKLPLAGQNLFIGPAMKLEYNYNLYPDLQSGFDYWFTDLSLGIGARYDFSYGKSSFTVKLNTTIAGFVSRQPAYRDPYFYDLGFKYAVRHLNQDLAFGSLSDFNCTTFDILWRPEVNSRFAFGYFLDYSGFYTEPDISIVNQGIKMIINKKQK